MGDGAPSNGAPGFVGDSRPGDGLYTACVLALNPDTGDLKWYFQFTPHDLYDYDANETPVLVDVEEGGATQHLLVQANRNGFLYVIDRSDGKFVRATPFVQKLNWATSVDASGRPMLSGRTPTAQGTYICPGIDGATNWFSPSYNPDTGLFFVMALEGCNLFFSKPKPFTKGETYYDTVTNLPQDGHGQKVLLSYSVAAGKPVSRYPPRVNGDSWGGTVTTAGGVVFFGDDAGSLEAVEARTGRALWHFNTRHTIYASPITIIVYVRQYAAIAAGNDGFTFSPPPGRRLA